MPKGHYDRSKRMSIFHPHSTWSDEQDACLQKLCKTELSYSQIMVEFNAQFPNDQKSRNAMLGRATREEYRAAKPKALHYGETNSMQNTRSANLARARKVATQRRRKLTEGKPVVFSGEDPNLREEGDRGDANSPAGSRRLGLNDPVVIDRRKGKLPSIVEQAPLTSMPIGEAVTGCCMWPTNFEATEVCGTRVTIGSYCSRHATAAYRVMPTAKRQRVRHKEDTEYRNCIDGRQHRDKLDADGEWLGRQLMAMDEVTIEGPPEGEHPLFIPYFFDSVAK